MVLGLRKMFEMINSNCNLWKYFQWTGREEWECKVYIPEELTMEVAGNPPLQFVTKNQEFPFHTDTPLESVHDKIRVYFSTDNERKFIDYILVELAQSSRVYKITSLSISIFHGADDGTTSETSLIQVSTTGNPTAFPFRFQHYETRLKDALYLTATISVEQAAILSLSGSLFEGDVIRKMPTIIPPTYSKFYDSLKFVDVTLIIEDEFRFPCHRLVLADSSPVFAQMFEYETIEATKREVEVEGVSIQTMKEFLQFLYTGSCDSLEKKDVERIVELYLIADRYLVDELKYLCGEIMESGIAIENCLLIWELARHHYDLHRVMRALTKFSFANRQLGGNDDSVLIMLAKRCFPWKSCSSGCSFCDMAE